jgi:TolB-like protein/Tfp pilus assembly protein PilF
MADIFISYSRRDSEQATALADRLRATGAVVWMDTAALAAAETWSAEIVSAIRDCKVFIVLISDSSVGSVNVTKEVALASEKNKSIVAIDLGEATLNDTMEYSLAGLHRVRYNDEAALQRTFNKLGIEFGEGGSGVFIAKSSSDKKRVAVIPFQDLSPEKDQEWFSEGLAYELIDSLSKLSKIFVVDKQTIREYKKTTHKTKELARELNVRYLIFGAVLKSGDKLRIQADLVDSQTGETIWNFKHTGGMDDIFDVQEKVSKQIADELELKLTPQEEKRLGERVTDNPEAYELYLRAYDLFLRQNKTDLEESASLYKQCIQLDPSCVPAYIGLANSTLAIYRSYDTRASTMAIAEEALAKAAKIDPSHPMSYSIHALLNHYKGNNKEAIAFSKKALAIAPDNPNAHFHLGFIYMNTGEHLLAAEEFENVLRLQPTNHGAHFNLAIEYENAKETDKLHRAALRALPIFEQYTSEHPDDLNKRMCYALFLDYSGNTKCFDEMEKVSAYPNVDGMILYNFAWVYAKHGMHDRALELLERSVDAGYTGLDVFADEPIWTPLREKAGWKRLVAKLTAIHQEQTQEKQIKKTEASVPIEPKRGSKKIVLFSIFVVIIVLVGGYFLFFNKEVQVATDTTKRIVILPFENLSANKDDEYFADGITTELINSLSKVSSINVIDRVTSMGYRGKKFDIKEIASQLGVTYIVEGTVRKHGDAIKVTASLFDVISGKTIWSGDFPGTMKDILETQEHIALEIVAGLQINLLEKERARFNARMTNNPQAYDLYIKGFTYRLNETQESANKAIMYLEKAVALDPKFVEAIVELGLANVISALYYPERMEKGRQWYLKAMALDSNNGLVLSRYAQLLADTDRDSIRSIRYAKRATEIEPTNALLYFSLGFVYQRFLMHNDAAEAYRNSIALRPEMVNSRINLYNEYNDWMHDSAAVYTLSKESLPYLQQYLLLHADHVLQRSFYIRMLAKAGQSQRALDEIDILLAAPNCEVWIKANAAMTAIELRNYPKAEMILEDVVGSGEKRTLQDILTLEGYKIIRTIPSWNNWKAKIESKLNASR